MSKTSMVSIRVPDALMVKLKRQAEIEEYSSVSAYIRHLINRSVEK